MDLTSRSACLVARIRLEHNDLCITALSLVQGCRRTTDECNPCSTLEECTFTFVTPPLKNAPAQPPKNAPAQPLKNAPAQPLKNAPAQPPKNAPAQLLENAPAQPLENAPAQPLENAPAHL
ncbi:uncharacterized protein M421DRAFT_253704 [Didymella exigua CBS 183.55]|uniref:Uncharacterized protein n=1 Tax=Didymella exigua CBS 183.55 TaxID=1150837 RepID=A0A6A5S053_9PLEO|nr:uncharacterized protein M421DRAFT_253704 [Didymella exigua CBS 183.55]KAF1932960.1 hypothetical protein M421DRAFT_253704 [Didymella exigua CBS 183.55]